MTSLRRAIPLALAVSALAAGPAAAAPHGAPGPVAHAAGSDGPPPAIPGLVHTRLVRTQKALDRAVDNADDGNVDKAVSALYTTRLQLRLAWRAAKHKIEHSPAAPPPGDGLKGARIPVRAASAAHRRKRARAAAIADQYATGGAVLDMQHTVAETAIGIIDTSHGKLRDSLSKTIFAALDKRDAAVAYIHSIDVPAPPGDGLAHASGAPVGGTWGSVMPAIADEVGDEIDQIEGVTALSSTLGVGIKRVLQDAELQNVKTQRTILGYWPPLPPD